MRHIFRFLFAILLLLAFFCVIDDSGIGFRQKWQAALEYIGGRLHIAQFLNRLIDKIQ